MSAGNTSLILGINREEAALTEEPLWRRLAELAAVALLALAAMFGPLALGGTYPLGKLGINLLVGAATILWAVTAPRSGWLAWLPITVAGGAILQIIPLPAPLLALVAPFSAGGDSDLAARNLGAVIPKYLKQNAVVMNKVGASGAIGSEQVKGLGPFAGLLGIALVKAATLPAIEMALRSMQ